MAGSLTLWGAGQLLNTFFTGTAEVPTSLWLALVKDVPPTPYISGAELDEVDAEDYARLEIPNDSVHWSNDGQVQVMALDEDVSFATATSDWGVIKYWALCNASADGYNYFVGSFENPDTVLTGDVVLIPAANISVALGPFFVDQEG